MKKIIVLAILAVALTACHDDGKVIYRTDTKDIYVKRVQFEGHTYISFYEKIAEKDRHSGWVHDPDCECYLH